MKNTPTNATDPSGMCPEIPLLCALAAGAAVGATQSWWEAGFAYLGGRKDITWGEILGRTLRGAGEGALFAAVGEGVGALVGGAIGVVSGTRAVGRGFSSARAAHSATVTVRSSTGDRCRRSGQER